MRLLASCTALILASAAGAQKPDARMPVRPPPTRVDIAPNIYLFQTTRYGDAGLDGNSVVIVSSDGVLVFDANGTPAAAAAILDEIRKLTSQPVKWLVLSHWHWDHWYGAEVYQQAFPGLEIIGHERTKAMMSGPALEFNQPFLDTQFPAHLSELSVTMGRAKVGGEADGNPNALADHLALDRWFLAQKVNTKHTVPTRTFTDSLTLSLGSRTVQVLHVDRAITPGDAFLWLPDERIAITADLLLKPATFGLFCYPSGWIRTLERLDGMDPAVIVPGHGAPMRDKVVLRATIDLLRREREMATLLKAQGKSGADAKTAILADSTILALRETLTGGNVAYREGFQTYLVDWVVPRIYQEIDGTLDASIPKAPPA